MPQSLTDEQIVNIMQEVGSCRENSWDDHIQFARAIEEVHGIFRVLSQKKSLDVCTDPNNCKRCKAMPWDKNYYSHVGIPV